MNKGRRLLSPAQDEVWIVDLSPVVGHEQGGVRPALIISEDGFNRSQAELVTIAPITTTGRRLIAHIRVDPPESGLAKPSFIMTDQVRTISKLRLRQRLGVISPKTRAEVETRLRIHLAL
jgi:mRNA interferase MazF